MNIPLSTVLTQSKISSPTTPSPVPSEGKYNISARDKIPCKVA